MLGYCFCCRRRQTNNNDGNEEGGGEQLPLLQRLRLRERLAERPRGERVQMEHLPLESGEVTPVSAVSDDPEAETEEQNPIIRQREPRARFHRSGTEMRVTIEV